MLDYLTDVDFLTKVFKNRQKHIKVKISSLTFDEKLIETLEGKVTNGSINIDGKSAMRRSCNLTLIPYNNIDQVNWGLETKFKLEIGIENPYFQMDNDYPQTLWFPQGIYLITSFSQSISTNNKTISISGKDKMALLNGEISGHFGQQTVLDLIETEEQEGVYVRKKYEIDKIIYDLIYMYGNENLHNIIINDLEKLGLKMVKYIGKGTIYIKQGMDNNYNLLTGSSAYTISSNLPDYNYICEDWTKDLLVYSGGILIEDNNNYIPKKEIQLNDVIFSNFVENTGLENQTVFKNGNEKFLLYKINYGDIAGYEATPVVFNDDLIAQPGETITAMLDKIVNMFGGAYEYFYNVEGQFVFQKKKTYIDIAWQPFSYYIEDGQITYKQEDNEFLYDFQDKSLISSISANPTINKVKNDYVIYGETNNGHPIHLRYAIDEKPKIYTTIRDGVNHTYATCYKEQEENKVQPDIEYIKWEKINNSNQIIYKSKNKIYFSMSKNNYNKDKTLLQVGKQIGFEEDLLEDSPNNLPMFTIINIEKTLLGRYRIYLDSSAEVLQRKMYKIFYKKRIKVGGTTSSNTSKLEEWTIVDWRELIYQMALDFHKCGQDSSYPFLLRQANPEMNNGKTGYEQYYTDLMGFWPDVYRYKENVDGTEVEKVGWNQEKIQDSSTLLYWLDFLNGDSNFNSLSVKNIGDRTLIKNEKGVSCLFEPSVPPILLYTGTDKPQTMLEYSPCRIPSDLESAFSLASFPKAAKTTMDTELSNNTVFAKTLNITTIPLYFLDVNHKIKISDLDNNIQGQFIINSFNIPLNYNGTMSISANEIVDSLY